MSEQRLLKPAEVAEILGIKIKTLYQWKLRRINLPFVKVGKSLRVDQKDLHDFIENQKINPSKLSRPKRPSRPRRIEPEIDLINAVFAATEEEGRLAEEKKGKS
jgi:excisionase family DNA binding protein